MPLSRLSLGLVLADYLALDNPAPPVIEKTSSTIRITLGEDATQARGHTGLNDLELPW